MPDNFIAHPKTQNDAFLDTANILIEANNALHSTDNAAKAKALAHIQKELADMTPAERELMAENFKAGQRYDDHLNIQTRTKDLRGLPRINMESDGKEIKSITFTSISDDNDFGKSETVSLNMKNAGYKAGDTAIERADGTHLVVSKDAKGTITEVRMPDGEMVKRQKDGSYLYYEFPGTDSHKVTKVSVGKDGSISYIQEMAGTKVPVTKSVNADGDVIMTTDMSLNGTMHHFKMTEHKEYPAEFQKVTKTTSEADGQVSVEIERMTWDGAIEKVPAATDQRKAEAKTKD